MACLVRSFMLRAGMLTRYCLGLVVGCYCISPKILEDSSRFMKPEGLTMVVSAGGTLDRKLLAVLYMIELLGAAKF